VGGSKVTLLFCFGPKQKFCSFDLDLDQAEQLRYHNRITTTLTVNNSISRGTAPGHPVSYWLNS
jgi:hypothetical protein